MQVRLGLCLRRICYDDDSRLTRGCPSHWDGFCRLALVSRAQPRDRLDRRFGYKDVQDQRRRSLAGLKDYDGMLHQ